MTNSIRAEAISSFLGNLNKNLEGCRMLLDATDTTKIYAWVDTGLAVAVDDIGSDGVYEGLRVVGIPGATRFDSAFTGNPSFINGKGERAVLISRQLALYLQIQSVEALIEEFKNSAD